MIGLFYNSVYFILRILKYCSVKNSTGFTKVPSMSLAQNVLNHLLRERDLLPKIRKKA